MLEDSRKLRLAEDFYIHGIDPERELAWLFNVSTGEIYDLSPHAFFIVSSLDGDTPLKDVVRKLVDMYPGENSEGIMSDFTEFIRSLESIGAVEEKEDE